MLQQAPLPGHRRRAGRVAAHAEPMEELVVTASHDTRTIDVTSELSISPDVAQLLKEAPGPTSTATARSPAYRNTAVCTALV